MKTVVILYEHISREYEVCTRLKEAVESITAANVFVFSLHFQMDQVYKLATKQIIDMIMVPYAYKEKSLSGLMLLVKRKRVKLILNLRHEQIGAPYNEHRLYPIDSFTKNRVFHIAWTDYYKEKLILNGVPEKHILVTQNPRTDLIASAGAQYPQKELFAQQYGLDAKKKWLLVCESGEVYSQAQITRMLSLGYREEDLREYNCIIERDKAATENQLNSLPDAFWMEYEVIYRPHPGTKCNLSLNNHIHVINSESIYCWLTCVNVVVSRMSTVLFEAQAKNVLAIWYRPNDIDDRFITYGIDELPVLENISQIDSVLVSPIKNDTYVRYIGAVNGKSIHYLAEAVSALLEDDKETLLSFDLQTEIPYVRLALRLYVSNKYSHIAFKSKCDLLLHRSKSLIVFENDIPPAWRE